MAITLLVMHPLAPSCFRLEGPDALPDAPARFERDAAAFGPSRQTSSPSVKEATGRSSKRLRPSRGRRCPHWGLIAGINRRRSRRCTSVLAGVTSWTLRHDNEQYDDKCRDDRRGQRAAQR